MLGILVIISTLYLSDNEKKIFFDYISRKLELIMTDHVVRKRTDHLS